MESKPIKKSHNVSQIIYHLVCPAKYRQIVFQKVEGIDEELRSICLEIEKRYDIFFLEIGTDKDHVHFLIQSVPMISPKKITQIVKSITAREVFKKKPETRKLLWGGEFWTKGYYINTVGAKGNENQIANYVKNQGLEYNQIHKNQIKLFEGF